MSNNRRVKGLHEHRFRDNPEERVFADAWKRENERPNSDTLAWLLGDGTRPVYVTDRDHEVAATVVQWLGSPVGQVFLRNGGSR